MRISKKQLVRMQKAREFIMGVGANPFTKQDIKRIYKKIIDENLPYISTGGFKFYLTKSKEHLMAEFDRPVKLQFALRGVGEK